MKYICVQPRTLYYAWQAEVMLNNFIKNGINQSDINILVATTINDNPIHITMWDLLVNHFKFVNFYFYEDTRPNNTMYISSIRPHLLKKHFQKYSELSNEVFFYHDCDIAFTKPVDFSNLLNDDVWYVSDTNSYINYDYITSKGFDIYDRMCDIVGIDKRIPKLMNKQSGGAQYIMKGLTSEYWEKVETDCERLYVEITKINTNIKKENPDYHELQIWCADMWAVLWNAWLFGYRTEIVDELNFCWPDQLIEDWNKYNIFHNAGVTGLQNMFLKQHFMEVLPYNTDNYNRYSTEFCSHNYYNEILQTSMITCFKDIIW